MCRLFVSLLVGFVVLMLSFGNAMATTYETAAVGISSDGQLWSLRMVEIPSDDYIEVDLNGNTVWLWGSEFDEDDLPPEALSTDCNCNIYLKMKCTCAYYCSYNGNFSGTCT